MASLTVEKYVKAIFKICLVEGDAPATTGAIASTLDVSPGTVTSMLKTLSEAGLAFYAPYEGVRLTDEGNTLALKILRRHRLIELFLSKSLNLDWDQVHADADQLEHAVSESLIEKIDAYLGNPQFDPHGDPIPGNDGSVATQLTLPLSSCQPGDRFRVARVTDQSPEFLRYLTRSGLGLGGEGQVVGNHPEASVVTVEADGQQTTLAHHAAESVLVAPSSQEPVKTPYCLADSAAQPGTVGQQR